MKLAIIGANGRLGHLLCREACDRGHEVTAVIRGGEPSESRVHSVLRKSIFDLTQNDLAGYDAVLSAFGGGIGTDPAVNRQAIDIMIANLSGTDTAYITVGGAGSLFTDDTRSVRVCETPGHPDFLREISRNLLIGLNDLRASENLLWTFVCPSLNFSYDAPRTGRYRVGTSECVLYTKNGESRVSYADFACAMLDIAENGAYRSQCITVVDDEV